MLFTRRGCLNSTYELSDAGRSVGTLRTRSGWKFEAVAHMRGRTVGFRQPKWWCRDFEAVDETTGSTLATYEASTWKTTDVITIGDERFTLKRSMLRSKAAVADASGSEVLSIDSLDWLGRKLEVVLSPGVAFDERVELLTYFACFARSLSQSDSSTAAVAAAVSV